MYLCDPLGALHHQFVVLDVDLLHGFRPLEQLCQRLSHVVLHEVLGQVEQLKPPRALV